MKKLVLGYFGYVNDQRDGQTIKTRLVGEIIKQLSPEGYSYYDTQNLKKNFLSGILKLIYLTLKAKQVIILPGENGLKVIFPLIYFISLIFKIEIYYIVIGGWLPEFLDKRKSLQSSLKKIKGIYVESTTMEKKLNDRGFNNVKKLNNFRKISKNKIVKSHKESNFKLVYFSRITETKGIYDLIDAFYKIDDEEIILDFYGPIDLKDEKFFFNEIKKSERINYKGVIKSEISSILSSYDLMVFPTFYEGEGFPGVIIDAYMSGLPILASDWKYNREYINNQETGIFFKVRDVNELKEQIKYFKKNILDLRRMSNNCLVEVEKYSFEFAKEFLASELKE